VRRVPPLVVAHHTQADGQVVESAVLLDGRVIRVAGPPDGDHGRHKPVDELRNWIRQMPQAH
jgi:hypothetical protein